MNNIAMSIGLALISGGAISTIAVYLINKGKQQKIIEQHEKDIVHMKVAQEKMKEEVYNIKRGTDIRLTKIETQITAIYVQQNEIAKDVKLILKQGIYKGE